MNAPEPAIQGLDLTCIKNPIINFPKSQTYGTNLRCSVLYLYSYLAAKVVQFNSLRPSDACIYVRVN